MRKEQRRKLAQFARLGRYRKAWRRIVRVLACIVVFCTTYALILPAITMDRTWYCGMEAHTHSEECTGIRISREYLCVSHGTACHTHGELCWDGEGNLLCPWPEEAPHIHGEGCYDEAGSLSCTQPQLPEHIHSGECVVTTQETVTVCRIPEHLHTDLCTPDPNFDLEGPEDWEKTFAHISLSGNWDEDLAAIAGTQMGYQESLRNYACGEDMVRKGYTRYGAWFGNPYAHWDAMFVSFCLHYSGIPHEAISGSDNSQNWMDRLAQMEKLSDISQRIPAAGDIAFFENEQGLVHAGIVSGVDTESDSEGTLKAARLQLIAGNVADRVDSIFVSAARILGIWDARAGQQLYNTPEQEVPMIQVQAETENYIVTVRYREDLALPEGAQLQVSEYSKDSEIYQQRCREAGYALEWLLNIGFFLDGQELELDGEFQVGVAARNGQSLGSQVAHFSEEGVEHLDGSEAEGQLVFSSDGFSDFGGGIALAAATANVNVSLFSYNEYCPIVFPTGNSYSCPVGSIITITLKDSGANYSAPNLTVSGAKVLSQSYSCGGHGSNHNGWCQPNPVHTIVLEVTGTNVSISGFVGGSGWGNSTVTISASGGTGSEETTPPEETDPTTQPTEPVNKPDPTYPHYPHAVHTGSVNISRLRFYNLAENGDNGVGPLPGCVFEVRGENGYFTTVTSSDAVEILLPSDIPDGTYTITEVSVPSGYMRDTEYERTFTMKNGALTSTNNIGTFINHDLRQMNTSKTAEVEDYNNRIYRILLSAESHMRMYEMGPVDVLFVVDQSNSMLFPSNLDPIGKSVQLRLDGNGNVNRMNQLDLDKNQMYYLISDPKGTSTVWCLWYNGQSWMYQDASYYAKAKHNNAEGYQAPNGEIAIFPQNRSYAAQADAEGDNERSNGGGLGYSLSGSGLGKDIDKESGDVKTYQLYTSPSEFNRLHYLQEALANMIYELADANDKNRVTLTMFTKEVKPEDDLGPYELTPDNAEKLVNAVRTINTDGGTRQDIALDHVYRNHLNDSSEGFDGGQDYTYTILITDGAPVISGGSSISNLGSPDDAPSTTADSVYAQIQGHAALVRSKSSLMTVGLGLDDVESGRKVLEKIASDNDFYCAMDDAADLVHNLQQLLFESFKPKEAIEIYADIADEISDSFYPIAWVPQGTESGRQFLGTGGGKDWVLPLEGDWLTLEGRLTAQGAADAAGQLLKKPDGTFYVLWKNKLISDPNWHYDNDRIAWVTAGSGAGTGRTVVATYGGKDWIQLNEGDWISQEGQYYSGTPSYWNRRYYGQIARSGEEYYVSWGSSANGNNRERFVSEFGWRGTFYVKAKEDFIGGNAIDTNKNATVTTGGATKYLPTPTVNVRLLEMNQLNSQVTVYLGDTVNEPGHSPLDSIQGFYHGLHFKKLISDSGDVLNRVTVGSAEGLEAAVFRLRYALGREITVDEWNTLTSGGTLTIPYVYDYGSSHGPVGEFTITLEKTGMAGAKPGWSEHPATAACQEGGTPLTESCDAPAETYTLNVVYRAYLLNEEGRPEQNHHNDAKGPGTQVGTGATVPTGAGTVTSENIHEVHVISGTIEILKEFAEGLTDTEDRTFSFTLHRLEDGEDTSRDVTKTITIPAGQSQGAAAIAFTNLPRGTYTVTEAVDENYTVQRILVTTDTNCYSEPAPGASAAAVTFVLGNDPGNANVIGRSPPTADYTSYINPGYGVYGEAVFTNAEIVYYDDIPVEKLWSDGAENHTDADAVYVVLYRDGLPVLDGDGNARLLRLNATSGWVGAFRVTLSSKEDSADNYDYSVREVSAVFNSFREGWSPGLLENDGTTVLYYETALEYGGLVGINNKGYVAEYETREDGTLVVRNLRAVELPATGGSGTHLFTHSGLVLILAALVYGCSQRRRQRRGAGG